MISRTHPRHQLQISQGNHANFQGRFPQITPPPYQTRVFGGGGNCANHLRRYTANITPQGIPQQNSQHCPEGEKNEYMCAHTLASQSN